MANPSGVRTTDPPFVLTAVPVLSRSQIPHSRGLRSEAPCEASSDRLLVLDDLGRAPTLDGRLFYMTVDHAARDLTRDAVSLGWLDGINYWTLRKSDLGAYKPDPWSGCAWADLREIGDTLSDTDCGNLTTAVAMLNWHDRGIRCPSCGAAKAIQRDGWFKRCEQCQDVEPPRVEPAAICLVHNQVGSNGTHVLIGQKPGRPIGWASLPAGFVDLGESLEECVQREVHEETGIFVENPRYLGSQPWPFPGSLLVAFAAAADDKAHIDTIPGGEFMSARWVSRTAVLAALADPLNSRELILPARTSIAYRMLLDWSRS
jgi:NAD+ diphosphatase